MEDFPASHGVLSSDVFREKIGREGKTSVLKGEECLTSERVTCGGFKSSPLSAHLARFL